MIDQLYILFWLIFDYSGPLFGFSPPFFNYAFVLAGSITNNYLGLYIVIVLLKFWDLTPIMVIV